MFSARRLGSEPEQLGGVQRSEAWERAQLGGVQRQEARESRCSAPGGLGASRSSLEEFSVRKPGREPEQLLGVQRPGSSGESRRRSWVFSARRLGSEPEQLGGVQRQSPGLAQAQLEPLTVFEAVGPLI